MPSLDSDDPENISFSFCESNENGSMIDFDSIYNSSESEDDSDCNDDFKLVLKMWALNNQITHNALKDLLLVLRRFTHFDLPIDPRTLLGTKVVEGIKEKTGGLYYHFGVSNGLNQLLKENPELMASNTVYLQINIDGLPLFKSNSLQLWPILGLILQSNAPYTEPFVIGVFSGNQKPTDVNEFLKEFVDEMLVLSKDGLNFNGHHLNVTIKNFICDTPARSFVKCVKSHNGYSGCDKCITEGTYMEGRMTFPDLKASLRNDVMFDEKLDEEHHRGDSILSSLGLAIHILISPSLCQKYADYAQQLLVSFISHSSNLYGPSSVVYNMHAVIHLPEDVKRFGSLDNFSAFPFENFLGRMWAVAIFNETEEVEAVPIAWLSPCQTIVSWPPFKATKVLKCMKEQQPADKTWPTYQVRILRRYENFEEAKKGSILAQETSDLNEDISLLPLGRGARVTKKRTFSSSEEEIQPFKKMAEKAVTQLPVPPKVPKDLASGESRLENESTINILKTLVEVKHQVISLSQQVVGLADTVQQLKDVIAQQARVIASLQPPPAEENFDVNLPLSSLEEFDFHEEKLSDDIYRKFLIAKLSHFGGIHLKHTIKKILDYMMTTTLQCQFNWAGKPGWKGNGVARRGFQHCQLCLVIADSVRLTKNLASTTNEEVFSSIKIYLRNARDRQGGRRRRLETDAVGEMVWHGDSQAMGTASISSVSLKLATAHILDNY
ncbi:transposase domain-containing protein [Biomphalaria glabrata]|nr:transposase domain-containing protein [Biomphalaria glabrata]